MTMTAPARTFRTRLRRWGRGDGPAPAAVGAGVLGSEPAPEQPVKLAPNDPIVAFFLSATGAVEIDTLELDSPALAELKSAGVRMVVPLLSQGELIGVLNLGPRRGEQDYSSDDLWLRDPEGGR